MYRVLWIDDQHNHPEMIQFAIDADNNEIHLDGYPSYEEGFEALEKNIDKYDIILLDGLFFEKKGQEIGTEDETGIGMAIGKINEIKSQKVFPWFVLSGKDKFTDGENILLKANKAQCFDKTNPSDVVQLFEVMKSAADSQPDFQLKYNYSDILKVCDNKYIGINQFERIFSLIKDIENRDSIEKTEDLLNPIRKIIEALFAKLRELGIIPTDVKSLNESSRFLSNKQKDYMIFEYIHPLVCENLHRLLNIIQDASHGAGELRLGVDEYLKSNKSDFLYKSSVYLLFDILAWFRNFIDNHDDVESNKTFWQKITDNDNCKSHETVVNTDDIESKTLISGKVLKITKKN